MIIDYIGNSQKYLHLHPLFKKGFDFLNVKNLDSLANGKHEIEAENLFVIVSRNGNSTTENPKLEVHRKYLDVHFIVKGTEIIGWKFLNDCKEAIGEFNIKDDYQLFEDKEFNSFRMCENQFMIVYPNDAHSPLLETENLFKLVLKIKI